MAIVKASFTRSNAEIKKTLHYIVHRPGKEGEKLTRELFGNFEEAISKGDAYRHIDAQQGMTYFHLKINFDPNQEDALKDLKLRDITRQTIATLEERFERTIRFFAVEHNDHTQLRHIHAIILVKFRRGERIGVEDWEACTAKATEQAGIQRRALDAVRWVQKDMQQGRVHMPSPARFYSRAENRKTRRAYRFHRVLYVAHPCPKCGNKQSLKTLRSGAKWCPVHGVIREERQEKIREQSQGLGL